tara:strand:- start:20 stop:385 length:366 start_codon:yes stop_codon:yes gene_type:complete
LVVLDLEDHMDGLLVAVLVVYMHHQTIVLLDRVLVVADQLELRSIQMHQVLIHLLQHLGQVAVMVVMVEVIILQEVVNMEWGTPEVVEVVEDHLFLNLLMVVMVDLDLFLSLTLLDKYQKN